MVAISSQRDHGAGLLRRLVVVNFGTSMATLEDLEVQWQQHKHMICGVGLIDRAYGSRIKVTR